MPMTHFDAYLMVDWSASSQPAIGPDSIWYCLLERSGDRLSISELENPATRCSAILRIRSLLKDLVWGEKAVLVGFDFPYSYPAGFAAALGVQDEHPWLGIWRKIASAIKDRNDNSNNRFEAAAQFNKKVSGGPYPFWGCPEQRESGTISRYKREKGHLPERRIAERYASSAQPVWKLFGAGSVGSQALLGIPYVLALRTDPVLAPVSKVWPFETGLRGLPGRTNRDWLVLYAEIYPSLLPVNPGPGEVKDAAQVRTLACHFAALDSAGHLDTVFAGNKSLAGGERDLVEMEEGWILGVNDCDSVNRKVDTDRQVRPAEFTSKPPAARIPPPRNGPRRTTEPGYENRNGQTVVRSTGLAGTDHGQYVYLLRCGLCRHEYGANGSDVFQRRCPKCQGGRPGLAF